MNGRRMDPEIKDVISNIKGLEMLKDMDAKVFADEDGYADIISRRLVRSKLKTSQLRKFFGAIRDIEREKEWDKMETQFYLLKPKLANSRGRDLIPEEFYQVMKVSMSKVDKGSDEDKVNNFNRMVEFIEAIVAYHKYYDPKS
ncbi:MAG: type III-A CRISPR-associated protein Csm2 [Methanobacteriales archaeon Met13]